MNFQSVVSYYFDGGRVVTPTIFLLVPLWNNVSGTKPELKTKYEQKSKTTAVMSVHQVGGSNLLGR